MEIDATTVVMAIVVDTVEAVMMIDAVVVASTGTAVMVAVEIGMMTDAVMMIDGTMTDVITIGMTHIRMVGEDTTEGATGMIVMVMVVVDSAAADAVSVLLMMTVHGGEMNLKFQLEEILEKKDQNDQNSTYYQEANRLMKIQIPHQPKRDQIHSGQLDQLTQVQKKRNRTKAKRNAY